jgi:hypothetical protein
MVGAVGFEPTTPSMSPRKMGFLQITTSNEAEQYFFVLSTY